MTIVKGNRKGRKRDRELRRLVVICGSTICFIAFFFFYTRHGNGNDSDTTTPRKTSQVSSSRHMLFGSSFVAAAAEVEINMDGSHVMGVNRLKGATTEQKRKLDKSNPILQKLNTKKDAFLSDGKEPKEEDDDIIKEKLPTDDADPIGDDASLGTDDDFI
eukprot:9417005-Ditylum_brightwellii.AAC.1